MMISSMSDALRVATLPVDDDFIVYIDVTVTFVTFVTYVVRSERLFDNVPIVS